MHLLPTKAVLRLTARLADCGVSAAPLAPGYRCTFAVSSFTNGAPKQLCGSPAVVDVEGIPLCSAHAEESLS